MSVARVSSYRSYPSWYYLTNPEALPLAQTCRYSYQNLWVWRRLWGWSVCSIILDKYVNPCLQTVTPLTYLSLYDLLQTWWMRGFSHKYAEGTACQVRYMISIHTLLWNVMARPPLLHLSVRVTSNDMPQPSHLLWKLGGGGGGKIIMCQ